MCACVRACACVCANSRVSISYTLPFFKVNGLRNIDFSSRKRLIIEMTLVYVDHYRLTTDCRIKIVIQYSGSGLTKFVHVLTATTGRNLMLFLFVSGVRMTKLVLCLFLVQFLGAKGK